MRDGRAAGSPEALGTAASASASLAEQLRDWGRDPAEIEAAWRDAAQDGRTADTQAGRETAAQALLGLADELREAGRRPTEIAAAYRDAVGAAREALALVRIAEASSEWSWSRERIAETCREAADAGRGAATPVGLRLGSIAMRLCGDALSRRLLLQSESREEIRDAYQQAANMGQQAQTPRGSIEASRALLALALALAHERWASHPRSSLSRRLRRDARLAVTGCRTLRRR